MTDDQTPTGALTEWAIAQVEAHPVRNAQTRAVTGYMLSADKWREIRAALRKAEAALAEAEMCACGYGTVCQECMLTYRHRAEKAEAELAEAEQKGAREALLAAADALDAKFSDKSGPALSGSGWLRDRAAQFGSEMACACGAPVAEHGGETDDCPVGGDS